MRKTFDAIGASAKRNGGIGVEGHLVMVDRTIIRTEADLKAWRIARGLESDEAFDQWKGDAAVETERDKAKHGQA